MTEPIDIYPDFCVDCRYRDGREFDLCSDDCIPRHYDPMSEEDTRRERMTAIMLLMGLVIIDEVDRRLNP